MSPETNELQVVRKNGVDFLVAFFAVFRTLKVYAAANKNAQEVLARFRELFKRLLMLGPGVDIQLTGNQFCLNGTKVVIGMSGYDTFNRFADELAVRGIGGLAVDGGVTDADLARFVKYFSDFKPPAAAAMPAEGPFPAFQAGYGALGIGTIVLRMISTETEVASADQEETETTSYLRTVFILYRIFKSAKEGKRIHLANAKKAIQKLVAVIDKDPRGIVTLLRVSDLENYLVGHSVNVCVFACLIARRLGLPRTKVADVGTCGLFHDLGMLRVPDAIARHTGPLTREQWEYIWVHPAEGAKMLLGTGRLVEIVTRSMQVAFEHQMRRDDRGYPPLAGDAELNLFTRIVKAADAFDSMTTDRPHRRALGEEAVFGAILDQSETAYERVLVKLLANVMGVYPLGAKIKLNTGELGAVHTPNRDPDYRDKPVVRVFADAQGHRVDKLVDMMEKDGLVFKYWIVPFDEHELDLDVSSLVSIL